MNFNLYLFGNPEGRYSQIPDDYLASENVAFQKDLKGSRLVIMRKMDLMHYIFWERINENRFIGIGLIFNQAYVAHPKQLVALFRDLIEDYLVKKGDIIRYTKEGELRYVIKSFGENPVRRQKLHELISEKFETAGAQYGILPLKSVYNGERTVRAINFATDEKQIVAMASSYNILIVDDTEGLEHGYIPQIIEGLKATINELKEQNASLEQQTVTLTRQKRQMKWILILLGLILCGCVAFYFYAHNRKQVIDTQSNEISHLGSVIDDNNEQISRQKSLINNKDMQINRLNAEISDKDVEISSLNDRIYSLNNQLSRARRDSANLFNSLNAANAKVSKAKKKLRDINYELTNKFTTYTYYDAWKSSNHSDGSYSEKTFTFSASAGDVLNIPYYVSSESGCDYLTISCKRQGYSAEQLVKEAGVYSGTRVYTIPYTDSYSLTIKYSKDGSVSKNNDNGGVKSWYIYRPAIENLRNLSKDDGL